MSRLRPAHGPAPTRRPGTLVALAALLVAASASYTVEPGDTLGEVAAEHGVATEVLATLNDLGEPDRILAGQRLALPEAMRSPARAGPSGASTRAHEVRPGEHLGAIARRYGVTVEALAATNDLADPDHVTAATTLEIPGAAAAPRDSSPTTPAASRGRWRVGDLIERTARAHGWSPAIVKALAWQESGWRNDRVSHAGAVGIMQVLPGTARFVSTNLAGRPLDLSDPEDNILAGVLFLDYLYDLTGGDAERTLAGYYQGLASVERHGLFADTRAYIDTVLALRQRFR